MENQANEIEIKQLSNNRADNPEYATDDLENEASDRLDHSLNPNRFEFNRHTTATNTFYVRNYDSTLQASREQLAIDQEREREREQPQQKQKQPESYRRGNGGGTSGNANHRRHRVRPGLSKLMAYPSQTSFSSDYFISSPRELNQNGIYSAASSNIGYICLFAFFLFITFVTIIILIFFKFV